MINVIRSEWIKFRSVRSNLLLVLAAGLVVVLIAFFAARSQQQDNARATNCATSATQTQATDPTTGQPPGFSPDQGCGQLVQRRSHLGDVTVGIPFALFLFGTLGVQILGQEYRFNTIRPTFTAVPKRLRVLLAKLIVVSSACAAVSVVMLGACALIGSVMIDNFSIDNLDHRVIWGTILFNVGWTAFGMGVGAIVRQPIAAIVILLIEAFVVEQIALGVVKATGPFLPFLNGAQMTIRDPGPSDLRSVTAGGIYFFIVAAAIWAIGAVLADRRDA